jgi:hypothetical protein
MNRPPFDTTEEFFANDIGGHLLPIEDPDYVPTPEKEVPPDSAGPPWRGCRAMIILAGALIGTALGTGFAAAGALLAGWVFDVPVPWPF